MQKDTNIIRSALAMALVMVLLSESRGDPPIKPRAERLRLDADRADWVTLPKPEPGTPAGDLALARLDFTNGNYKKARKRMLAWEKTYGDDSEYTPEALLLLAQTEKAKRHYYQAQQLLDRVVNDYRGSSVVPDALVEMFNIAEVYLSGVRRKFWGMRLLSTRETALDILDRIASEFPDSDLAELAIKTKGDYFFRRGEFALAGLEYDHLLKQFPASRYGRYAMRRSADASLASFAGVRFDAAPLIEAEDRYRLYARSYPNEAERGGVGLILQDIREKRAAKDLRTGDYYRKTGHGNAADFYYHLVVADWSGTIAAAKAARMLPPPTPADNVTESVSTTAPSESPEKSSDRSQSP